jgi:16S rRNA (adenine1518-N6/adenine1519-N6)-dimethyltransferase
MSLLDETKLILRKHGLRPKRYSDQNFLIDSEVLQRQVGYADIRRDEIILEIGPGIGNLTELLLERSDRVLAVEKDPAMVDILRHRFAGMENLEIISGDALKIKLPAFDKVVSNIPYSISSPLTFMLLKKRFKKAVITYQKEFAERMVALPGSKDYSRLSVTTDYYASARVLEILPPRVFYPPPEVNSAVVELVPRRPWFMVDEKLFFGVVRALFAHRGKTVKNALVDSRFISSEKKEGRRVIEELLDETTLEKRVFQLKPKEIAGITNVLMEAVE